MVLAPDHRSLRVLLFSTMALTLVRLTPFSAHRPLLSTQLQVSSVLLCVCLPHGLLLGVYHSRQTAHVIPPSTSRTAQEHDAAKTKKGDGGFYWLYYVQRRKSNIKMKQNSKQKKNRGRAGHPRRYSNNMRNIHQTLERNIGQRRRLWCARENQSHRQSRYRGSGVQPGCHCCCQGI